MFCNLILIGEDIKRQINRFLIYPDISDKNISKYLKFNKISPSSYHVDLDKPRNELKTYDIIYSRNNDAYGYYTNLNGIFLNYEMGYSLLYSTEKRRYVHTSYNYTIDWPVTMQKSNQLHYLLSHNKLYNLSEINIQELITNNSIIKVNSLVTMLKVELD